MFSTFVVRCMKHCLTNGEGRGIELVVGLGSARLNPEKLALTSATNFLTMFSFEIGRAHCHQKHHDHNDRDDDEDRGQDDHRKSPIICAAFMA